MSGLTGLDVRGFARQYDHWGRFFQGVHLAEPTT